MQWTRLPTTNRGQASAEGPDGIIVSSVFTADSLLSQSEAFQLDGGAFGHVDQLWELDFDLGLVLAHHT